MGHEGPACVLSGERGVRGKDQSDERQKTSYEPHGGQTSIFSLHACYRVALSLEGPSDRIECGKSFQAAPLCNPQRATADRRTRAALPLCHIGSMLPSSRLRLVGHPSKGFLGMRPLLLLLRGDRLMVNASSPERPAAGRLPKDRFPPYRDRRPSGIQERSRSTRRPL